MDKKEEALNILRNTIDAIDTIHKEHEPGIARTILELGVLTSSKFQMHQLFMSPAPSEGRVLHPEIKGNVEPRKDSKNSITVNVNMKADIDMDSLRKALNGAIEIEEE